MDRQAFIDVQLSPGACIVGALALLILPLRWIAGAVFAAVFHEWCHYLALRICGIRIFGFAVSTNGAVLETEPMDRWQELICALAGPAGSFLLALMHRWLPVAALCAGVQGLYNLLPLYPFDGGRVLRCLVGAQRAEIICRILIFALAVLGIYCFARLKMGFGMMAAVYLLIHRAAFRKIPCKDRPLGVQ